MAPRDLPPLRPRAESRSCRILAKPVRPHRPLQPFVRRRFLNYSRATAFGSCWLMSSDPREDRVKCLLGDDRPDDLLALGSLLQRDDVDTLLAHSGAEALELLRAHDVALAFLDVQ